MQNTQHLEHDLSNFGYQAELHRTLSLWQLTAFGLTYLQPIGPAVIFGFLMAATGRTVALPYLLAFVGMIFTIFSYSILIKEYPLAGSIYNYVKFIGGPFFGFLAGWLLGLDYILIPTITSVSAAIYAHQLIPSISYEAWLVTFVMGMGCLNLIGVRSTAYFNSVLLLIQIGIVLLGFFIWAHYLIHSTNSYRSLLSFKPFNFVSWGGVIQASSIAIFSFLGFDAVTTLAEEAVNPRRDIPRAMLICTFIGFSIMLITGYLGVLVILHLPSLKSDSSWINATLFNLARLTGGNYFSFVYTVGFVIAMMITNLVGTTAATRLLFGMGRDNKFTWNFFAAVNKRWQTPHGSILFIVILELILGSYANQDQLAELINYGAISGFIILNASVIWMGWSKLVGQRKLGLLTQEKKWTFSFYLKFFVFPVIALVVMGIIFANMKKVTLLFGTIWGISGVAIFLASNSKINKTFPKFSLK